MEKLKKLKLDDLTPAQTALVLGRKGEAARGEGDGGGAYGQTMLREREDGSRFVQFYRGMKLAKVEELPVARAKAGDAPAAKFAAGERVTIPGPSGRHPLRGTVARADWNAQFRRWQYGVELDGGGDSSAWEGELRREGRAG